MADIICARCGEPWDSTGGLHPSHSDMEVEDYNDLLQGAGCPCCRSNLRVAADIHGCSMDEAAYSEENVDAWRASIERVSEGEYEYMYLTQGKEPLRTKVSVLEY
jgi:hypothetical protein